jgi:hypothetical protein
MIEQTSGQQIAVMDTVKRLSVPSMARWIFKSRVIEFEPAIIKKRQSNITGIEWQILAMHAKT